MKRVWAPWRIKYILGEKTNRCIFCIRKTKGYKKRCFILTESKHSFVILNKYPYTAGHLMVVSKRHVPDLDGLSKDELNDFFLLVRFASQALKKAINPDGLNLGANLGKSAGAGEGGHFHFHIVARWNGDHNFMPVIGSTMAIPEYLDDTYKRLLPYFVSVHRKGTKNAKTI
jgi:ATP adenylyltransferase